MNFIEAIEQYQKGEVEIYGGNVFYGITRTMKVDGNHEFEFGGAFGNNYPDLQIIIFSPEVTTMKAPINIQNNPFKDSHVKIVVCSDELIGDVQNTLSKSHSHAIVMRYDEFEIFHHSGIMYGRDHSFCRIAQRKNRQYHRGFSESRRQN